MIHRRSVVLVGGAVLAAVVIGVVVLTDGSAADLVIGLLAVAAVVLLADLRLLQRRAVGQVRRLAKAAQQTEARTTEAIELQSRTERALSNRVTALDGGLAALRKEVGDLRPGLDRTEAVVQGLRSGPFHAAPNRIVEWHQIESLHSLYSLVQPRQVMPSLRGFAASPDLVAWIVAHVLEHRPRLVLECGSGASTLWIGYALERVGAGKVVSLEHHPRYAGLTQAEVARHSLGEFVDLRLAPIRPVAIEGTEWPWYDVDALVDLDPVDLLVVDGPPGDTGPLARYPAGPLVARLLAPDAVIVLDDAVRKDEQTIAERWQAELGLDCERVTNLEKQAFVLRRSVA